jgi:hypothetical protein
MYIRRYKTMKRTQVYLPEELYEQVRRVSYEQKKSMAAVVRQALTEYLLVDKTRPRAVKLEEERELSEEELRNHPLYQIIGMCSTDIEDGAEKHDYYLYGENMS